MTLPSIDNLIHTPNAAYPDAIKVALLAMGIFIVLHAVLSMVKRRGPRRPRWGWWSRLVYLGTITGVAILGATSIYSILAHGHMEEWFLFVHLTGAGMFTACLALIAITFAHRNRFGKQATHTAADAAGSDAYSDAGSDGDSDHGYDQPAGSPFGGLAKITFWLLLISGVATAATMLFSMLPIMGTHDMEQMLTIHRYAGLMLVVVTVVHVYLVVMGRLGRA